MSIGLFLILIAVLLLQIAACTRNGWPVRKAVAAGVLAFLPGYTVVYVYGDPSIYTFAAAGVSVGVLFNMLRLIEGRRKQEDLQHSSLRTALWLSSVIVILAGASAFGLPAPTGHVTFALLCVLQLCAAVIVSYSAHQAIRRARFTEPQKHYSDTELPTVTVAIPARNETAELQTALESILASNYPKLEIIVLDDCSHDKTPDIIRQYAHAGVRFIQGVEPDSSWLAKNAAYQRLYEEASGQYIVFCGVDTRFSVQSVKQLITCMLEYDSLMMSVLPRRMDSAASNGLLQPMRYWWELAVPRNKYTRPPVLSSAWVIRRSTLKKIGAFTSFKRSVLPEAHMAKRVRTMRADAYRFVLASDALDIQSKKTFYEQRQTALRVNYPQIHRRPEIALLLASMHVLLLIGPYIAAISAALAGLYVAAAAAGAASLLLTTTHVLIVSRSQPAGVPLAIFTFPVAAAAQLVVGLVSAYKYEFSEVEWKGRNVCMPVMYVVRKLPKV